MRRMKTKIIWLTCGMMNWVSDHVRYDDLKSPIGWRDYLRWCIEGVLNRIFDSAYHGSAEEIRDGIELALAGTVNPEWLTPVQREIRARLCEWTPLTEETKS